VARPSPAALMASRRSHAFCMLQLPIMATPLQIRNMPDDALDALRERAARRHLSLAAYAREVLVREAARATMDDTLAGPRLVAGRRLTARQIRQMIRSGRG
jgi:plasmid stability protein